jgi:hypothetical protein
MRRGDLVPLVLIGGIVAFVAVQVAGRDRPSSFDRSTESSTVQGEAAPQGAASADAPGIEIATRPSDKVEPAPPRDDASIRTQIADNASLTYLQGILDEQGQMLFRWPDRRLNALRVWIDRRPTVSSWNVAYALAAERAFDEWREAGFPVAFDFVHDSASSHVWIQWADAIAAGGRRIGVTYKTRDQHGWIVAARIVVALHDPRGTPLPESTVHGVVRHEVGHALGLGHSENPNDVMYPESHTPVISAADRATLHLLYRLPPGLVR